MSLVSSHDGHLDDGGVYRRGKNGKAMAGPLSVGGTAGQEVLEGAGRRGRNCRGNAPGMMVDILSRFVRWMKYWVRT